MRPHVVFLPNPSFVKRLFRARDLDRISRIADVTMNEEERALTPDAARHLLGTADVCITSWGSPAFDASVLAGAPRLQRIIHAAGSVKPIVTDAVWDRNIVVTSGAPAIAVGVAETTLGLMITSLKGVWELSRATRGGQWREPRATAKVKELFDVTIGLIGFGHVGRHLARLLQLFEVEVLVCDPLRTAEEIAALGARKVELEELLRRSDVVSLHAPAIPATRHMLNKKTLAWMKDDAILINTARGALICEEDLVAELRKGRLWACIDVTDPEPPAPVHPLRGLPNVILTPHIAGSVNNGLQRLGRYAADEIEAFVAGRPPVNGVAKEALAQLA